MFRKAIVVLALIAASALFFGVAAPAANAGNCTAITFNYNGHPGPIWYDGVAWAWNPTVGGCTGVNGIEILDYTHGGSGAPPFLYDSTRGQYHIPYFGGGYCYAGNLTSCNKFFSNNTWGGGCGQPAFYVTAYATYRIRSITVPGQGTWGPYHNFNSVTQLIC